MDNTKCDNYKNAEELMEFMVENNVLPRKNSKYSGVNILMQNLPYIYDKLVEGCTPTDICRSLGVTLRSWQFLKSKSPNFINLLKLVESDQIQFVKSNLIKKSSDHYVPMEKILPNGRVVKFNKFVPADTNAIKFYLTNKSPNEFSESRTLELKKPEIIIDIVD